jgi:DNA-directed RNA polymerase subunit RPC12/RpoP
MPATAFTCPECDATFRASRPLREGARARCPRCGSLCRAGGRQGRERPRRSPARGAMPRLLLAGGILLVLAGLGAGVCLLVAGRAGRRKPENLTAAAARADDERAAAQVSALEAGLDRVTPFLARADVEAALGNGREATEGEVRAALLEGWVRREGQPGPPDWVRTDRRNGAAAWCLWRSGRETLVVGFARGESGTQRAVSSYLIRRNADPSRPSLVEVGLITVDLGDFVGDPDGGARWKAEEARRLAAPRWKTGPAVRRALVGKWGMQHPFREGYEFAEGGTYRCRAFYDHEGTYRFTDDRHVELTLTAGGPGVPRRRPLRYEVLVDEDELVLVSQGGGPPRASPAFRRAKAP